MSLKIWITGNGNVENQGCGLLDNPFISSPVYDSGKLGKCIKLTNIRSNLVSLLDEPTSRTFSASYWVRLDSSSYDDWADIFGLRFVTGDGTVGEFREELHVADSTLYTNFFGPPLAGSDVSITNDSSNQITVGEWVHDTITCDGSILRWYRNDKEIRKYTIASNIKGSVNWQGIHIGSSAAQMSMCDFRLYDHCLSKKEIHEIYKSLVLHYPLNNPFGNPNLVPNTFDWDGFYLHTGGSLTDEYYRGFRVLKCSMPASSSNSYQDACGFSVSVEPSTTYTLSFYYKGWSFESFFHPSNVASGKNNTGSTTTRVDGYITTPSNDTWKKYTITWTTLSTVASGTSKSVIPIRLTRGSTDKYGYICGIKFEKGDTATPWCPNSADEEYSLLGLDSNIIADCSGYGNDGKSTIYPALATITHSPRYSSSIWYGASDYINCGSNTKPTDEITVSMWVYKTDWSTIASNINKLISNTHNGGWNIILHQSRNYAQIYINGAYVTADISPTITSITPGWHMFTFTYDGYQLKSYFDGEIYASSTATTNKNPIDYGTTNTATFVNAEASANGAVEATNADSFIYSDIRIYATALTAEDIKELYQTPFSIDKNGNVFGYNFMEV